MSDNPARANVVEAENIIAVVLSKVNMVTSAKDLLLVDSGTTRHSCGNRSAFTSFTPVGNGE